ncbi:hypothetical protein SAMN02745165_00057 [Malonomonas rubra DSM 5091]|uniref:Uncharacterized protein n=1 Tax=Malonomonas rubra DSM 5091 TaxID=1122189 RepID=A0A1M6B6K1_MALRU|nr:hypothetical protein [Malonomonas rubra]SHI44361.1 hypothetical protein SAMN02745165_00057 [Malonomonas rubra DSM 5091]
MSDFYRFKKVQVIDNRLLKGETSWYEIYARNDSLLYRVHVVGSCLGGTTKFYRPDNDQKVVFSLRPKRKFLNLTFFVFQGDDGAKLATLHLKTTRGIRVCDDADQQLYSIVDPRKIKEQFIEDILGGWCGEYALLAGDNLLGRFDRRAREQQPEPEKSGFLNRLRRGILKGILRDWCLELSPSAITLSPEFLLPAAILLQEQSIRLDQTH